MEFFKWKDDFSVNNQRLDQQHKAFLETLNRMYRHIGSADSVGVFEKSVSVLGHYIDAHFTDEENYLEAINYPSLEEQKKQHAFFRAQVTEMKNSYSRLSAKELDGLLVFMRDWFLKHILEEDKNYARFISVENLGVPA